jgi:hypothetical protein
MKFFVLLLVLLIPATVSAQTAGPRDSIRFDYSDADLASYGVIRFEICLAPAGGQMTCTATPDLATMRFIPAADQGGPPASGFTAYRTPLTPLQPGVSYTAGVRACSSSQCGLTGLNGELPVSFRFVPEPVAPANQQLIRGGE